jgi:hypothetical protein
VVSDTSAWRWTTSAGEVQLSIEAEALAQLNQAAPDSAAAPELLQISADGAMIAMRGGGWSEVRTLAVGEVVQQLVAGEAQAKTVNLSYYSRHINASEFTKQSWLELWRRGCEGAKTVLSISDGAPWIQELADMHRYDAVRILDYPHAMEYVAKAGHAHYGEGASTEFERWYLAQAHELKHGQAERVIAAVAALGESEAVRQSVNYLSSRQAMLNYREFQAKGYPIGSGCVESANKVVVERRMKGAGMRWSAEHINAMLAMRNLVCNKRWAQGWAAISARQVKQHKQPRQASARPVAVATTPAISSAAVEAVKKEVGHALRYAPVGKAKYLTYTERVSARR